MFSIAALVATAFARVGRAAEIEINSCGQGFHGGGYLTADLDCTTLPDGSFAVYMTGGARLDLNGFRILARCNGVWCGEGKCSIGSTGGQGAIVGTGACGGVYLSAGVWTTNTRAPVVMDNVAISGFEVGLSVSQLALENSVISQNLEDGIAADSSYCPGGYACPARLNIRNSSIVENGGAGILLYFTAYPGRVLLDDSEVSRNGSHGISGHHVRMRRATISENAGSGLEVAYYGSVKVQDSTVTSNGRHGLFAEFDAASYDRIRALRSTATGNGTGASCGTTETCADIASATGPKVTDLVCDKSYKFGSGFPGVSWGVCSLD